MAAFRFQSNPSSDRWHRNAPPAPQGERAQAGAIPETCQLWFNENRKRYTQRLYSHGDIRSKRPYDRQGGARSPT